MLKERYIAELYNLEKFKNSLDAYLRNAQISDSKIQDIELATEELLVNIISYSYPHSKGFVELNCSLQKDILILKIIDEGTHFDPTKSQILVHNGSLKEKSLGGMGIHLAKSLVNEMRYQRDGNKNILSLIVKI
jgi:serine/threonine-protein kinase RsbW